MANNIGSSTKMKQLHRKSQGKSAKKAKLTRHSSIRSLPGSPSTIQSDNLGRRSVDTDLKIKFGANTELVALTDRKLAYSGYLMKLGSNLCWQTRFFKFDGTSLICFRSQRSQLPSVPSFAKYPPAKLDRTVSNASATSLSNHTSKHFISKWKLDMDDIVDIRVLRLNDKVSNFKGWFGLKFDRCFVITDTNGEHFVLKALNRVEYERWLFILTSHWPLYKFKTSQSAKVIASVDHSTLCRNVHNRNMSDSRNRHKHTQSSPIREASYRRAFVEAWNKSIQNSQSSSEPGSPNCSPQPMQVPLSSKLPKAKSLANLHSKEAKANNYNDKGDFSPSPLDDFVSPVGVLHYAVNKSSDKDRIQVLDCNSQKPKIQTSIEDPYETVELVSLDDPDSIHNVPVFSSKANDSTHTINIMQHELSMEIPSLVGGGGDYTPNSRRSSGSDELSLDSSPIASFFKKPPPIPSLKMYQQKNPKPKPSQLKINNLVQISKSSTALDNQSPKTVASKSPIENTKLRSNNQRAQANIVLKNPEMRKTHQRNQSDSSNITQPTSQPTYKPLRPDQQPLMEIIHQIHTKQSQKTVVPFTQHNVSPKFKPEPLIKDFLKAEQNKGSLGNIGGAKIHQRSFSQGDNLASRQSNASSTILNLGNQHKLITTRSNLNLNNIQPLVNQVYAHKRKGSIPNTMQTHKSSGGDRYLTIQPLSQLSHPNLSNSNFNPNHGIRFSPTDVVNYIPRPKTNAKGNIENGSSRHRTQRSADYIRDKPRY